MHREKSTPFLDQVSQLDASFENLSKAIKDLEAAGALATSAVISKDASRMDALDGLRSTTAATQAILQAESLIPLESMGLPEPANDIQFQVVKTRQNALIERILNLGDVRTKVREEKRREATEKRRCVWVRWVEGWVGVEGWVEWSGWEMEVAVTFGLDPLKSASVDRSLHLSVYLSILFPPLFLFPLLSSPSGTHNC